MSYAEEIKMLQERALEHDIMAYQEMLRLLQKLYHNHEEEIWVVGSFLFEQKNELISAIASELIESYSVDESFESYDYVFNNLSTAELVQLEENILGYVNQHPDFEVINYEIMCLYLESLESVQYPQEWSSVCDKAIENRNLKYQDICQKTLISYKECFIFWNVSFMGGSSCFLRIMGLSSEVEFQKWVVENKQECKDILKTALDSYINGIERLKLRVSNCIDCSSAKH